MPQPLIQTGQAGGMESSDIQITLMPAEIGVGIELDLTSIVMAQYGRQIEQVIRTTLAELEITDAYVVARDRGALDYAIRARLYAAAARARGEA